jgi:hypothetical protein
MPHAPVRIFAIYLMALAAGVCSWSAACTAATFELARRADGTIIRGVKLEGEIVPGDALKLVQFYNAYGDMMSPIYLRSKGGNVDEAMKMGAIIRRLRLETNVPVWDAARQPIDGIRIDHQDNMICASACFLVYAGGAMRFGNYLALHRPFLPREEARKINDAEYEALQKQMLPKVKAYLADMEIDQYWIDRMFAASSQERYMPTWAEADSKVHHLMGIVPSLEEIMLSKCNQDPDVDRKLLALRHARSQLSADDQEKSRRLIEDSMVFSQCQETVLSDMRSAAFDRENDATLKESCRRFPALTDSEFSTLRALLAKGTNVAPDEDKLRLQLFSKHGAYQQCWSMEAYALHFAATNRWSNEIKNSKRIASNSASEANDFEAKGLSAEAMAKKGKDAYDAENYIAAKGWFEKAAALGNAEAMMGISWLYGNGHGFPKDETEAFRWHRMSAENGNTDAMYLVGAAYEEGKVVPQDYTEAMRWFKMGADRNDALAMKSIASLHEQGRGVTRDYAEAMRWLKKAVDLGDSFAAYCIGNYYLLGFGVPKDESKAREWMKRAVVLGDTSANRWLIDNP